MEYLAVFAIAAMMTIPLLIIFITQQDNIQADIAQAQAQKIAGEIVQAAEEVYFMGPPSQKTIRLTFPEGISNVTVHESYISIVVSTANTHFETIRETDANLTGSIRNHPGQHVLVFRAESGQVVISDN